MASSTAIQSPADAANLALVRMGYKLRIGSLYDGSPAAKKVLDVYAQTRDDMLRSFDWGFAERNIALTLLKQAPVKGYLPPITPWNPATNPPLGFLFEYAYPDDALKVRAVKPTALFFPNVDPRYNAFAIVNDNAFTPARRVIVCNVAAAIGVYTGQVTDPATWDVNFVAAFAQELAKVLGPALVGMDSAKITAPEAQQGLATAESEQG